MVNLKNVYFGCADADTEAIREPLLFQKSFFDPHDYLNELINGDRYIVKGRKGDGKSAYGAKITLMSDSDNIKSHHCTLSEFNNLTFQKLSTYENLGGNPYISFWKCLLMIECVKMLERHYPNIQKTSYIEIVDALRRAGLLETGNDISLSVLRLVETNTSLSLKSFVSHGRNYQKEESLHGTEQIFSAIMRAIKDVYLTDYFVMVIDGLDDVLSNTEYRSNIITGLIRASEDINNLFRKETLRLKVLLLIRDDVLSTCRDPNLSKTIRDSAINLSWRIADQPFSSDLLRLVNKRFAIAAGVDKTLSLIWDDLFPCPIEYVLDNIIYRPRDILQFFIEAQKEFIPEKPFTYEKLQTVLFNYSCEYFVDAMKDELTGFFCDDAVSSLPTVLSKMGEQYFYMSDFEEECKKYPAFDAVNIRNMLSKLFNDGYIGQHRPRASKDYTVFSYRNPLEKFVDNHECILHRGLLRALTI